VDSASLGCSREKPASGQGQREIIPDSLAQSVTHPPHDNEKNDVRRILKKVKRSTGPFIEELLAGSAAELPYPSAVRCVCSIVDAAPQCGHDTVSSPHLPSVPPYDTREETQCQTSL